MSNTLQKLVADTFKFGLNRNGVLTTQQAMERLQRDQSLVAISSHKHNVFFFADYHTFGYKIIPNDFVPCSAYLPMKVTPREGLPTGEILTIADFLLVFHKGERQIETMDDLATLIDNQCKHDETFVASDLGSLEESE